MGVVEVRPAGEEDLPVWKQGRAVWPSRGVVMLPVLVQVFVSGW